MEENYIFIRDVHRALKSAPLGDDCRECPTLALDRCLAFSLTRLFKLTTGTGASGGASTTFEWDGNSYLDDLSQVASSLRGVSEV